MLGGDCSILLGAMLALRRRGRFGLLHVDGHLDFRHPGWSGGIGAVAGEDLAGVTGRLEPALSDIDGLSPYVADADTVHLGERERDPGERTAIAATGITVVDLPALRAVGPVTPEVPYWLHVDADVLDLPAVDSPAPGGLSFAELSGAPASGARRGGRRPGHGLRPRPGRGRLAGARPHRLPRQRAGTVSASIAFEK